MPVDQSPELRHGASRVVEPVLVKIHQRKPNPNVVSGRERMRAQTIELDCGALRLGEWPTEEPRAAQGSAEGGLTSVQARERTES